MIELAHWLLLSVANVPDRVARLRRLRAAAALAILAAAAALAILLIAAVHSLGAASAAPTSEIDRSGDDQTLAIAPLGGQVEVPETSHSTVPGRLFVRVRALPRGNDGGAWRIEFGFLTDSILYVNGASGRSAAVQANTRLLPSSRFVSEATLRSRARTNNRRWLVSTPVRINLSGSRSVQGRVIARWNPKSGGDFRVEFGWLPEQARQAAGGNSQAAVAANGAVLPSARYLNLATILSRAAQSPPRWLFSASIDAPVTGGGGGTPPVISWRGYPSDGASVGATLSPLGAPTATVDGRPVQLRYRYSAAPTSVCGVDASGRVQLRTAGVCRVTATSVAGTYVSASKTVTVRSSDPPPSTPVITWRGYPTQGASVGQTLSPLSAPTATVAGRPVQLQYRFGATPPGVCGVNPSSGQLQLRTAGVCRVTATSAPGTYPSASKTVTVQVVAQPTPVISWRGYPSGGASVGATLSPLGPPTATVDGRPVQLRYRYGATPPGVCGVNLSGQLQLRMAGVCRVTATSVAGTYPSASKTVTVQVVSQPPVITWRGYPTQGASVGATLSPLSAPTATVNGRPVQLQYRYNTVPTTVCGVDARGQLQLRTAGVCRVTATSVAGTYPSASKTVTVQVVQPQPVITWRGYPSNGASVGATLSPLSPPTATVGGRPVSLQYRYNATPSSVCRVDSSGTLTLLAAGDCRVTATSVAGTYAPASAPAVTVRITRSTPEDPPASGFAYCGGDTIKVWYFERSAGTRHHLDITWQEANATFVESWWSTIGNMSDSDCGTWRTGRDYGLSDAERIADRRGIRAPKTRVPPPASGFAYCGDDTIRVYYFHPSAGTRHHLSITWQEANATFGGSWWNTIGNMSASDCGTWPLGRVYYLRDAQGLPGAAPTPPTGGGTSGGGGTLPVVPPNGGGGTGGTQPPLPLPEPPASRLARCDGDTIRVWYFHPSAGTKHHLNLTWEQATAIFGSSWGNTIGSMSASDCARWTTGRTYGESDARLIPR